MDVLHNAWYMIAWADELPPGTRLTRTIADEPFCLANIDGAFRAHSAGGARRSIATVLKHRIVWIWLGDLADHDESLIPDFSPYDDAKETAFFCGRLPTVANYELLTDNILDLSHADFLHPDTLGGGVFSRNRPKFRRNGDAITLTWEGKDEIALPIFDRLLPKPGQPAHVRISVRWNAPASMLLRVRVAPAGEPFENWFDTYAAHIMTPASDLQTHYFYGSTRNYRTDDAEFNSMQSRIIRRAFEGEDKPLIEAQQRNMGKSDLWSLHPVLLQIDTGPVQARRLLAKMIANEHSRIAA